MGAAVLRTRLQNLYDWQPFTYHVTRRRSLPSLIRIHISWSFRFKHNAQTLFISHALVHSLTWLTLPSRIFRISSPVFFFPQHWTLTSRTHPEDNLKLRHLKKTCQVLQGEGGQKKREYCSTFQAWNIRGWHERKGHCLLGFLWKHHEGWRQYFFKCPDFIQVAQKRFDCIIPGLRGKFSHAPLLLLTLLKFPPAALQSWLVLWGGARFNLKKKKKCPRANGTDVNLQCNTLPSAAKDQTGQWLILTLAKHPSCMLTTEEKKITDEENIYIYIYMINL